MADTVRTNPPAFYLPPTREEAREMADKVGLKSFSRDLVADLCNLAAGGEIRPPSDYREAVRQTVESRLPEPDESGYYRLNKGGSTMSRQEALADRLEAAMRYHQNVCDFLQTLDLNQFPGASPLEQSMNMLKLMFTQKGGQPGGDGESLPIFSENDNSENIAEQLNSVMDEVESLDDAERELLEEETQASGSGGDADLQKMQLAEDMLNGKEHILKISRKLDKLTRMKVSKSSKVEPDPAGDEVRQRPIAHFGELNRLNKSEWALPSAYRTFRVVTHAAQVRERVTRVEKKQLLYMIIDCSGSMDSGKRISSAGGVLFNRLKAVVKGEAEIYVRFFDTNLREEHHAATPAEAKELMKLLAEHNFSGGGTDISGCAKAAMERIDEILSSGTTAKPELVVVTDGDDTISLKTEEVGPNKLHAFVVQSSNTALTDLAVKTGGVGINNL